MSVTTLRQRRQYATRWFIMRVLVMLFLIGGIAYSSWFAPWARPIKQVTIITGTAK